MGFIITTPEDVNALFPNISPERNQILADIVRARNRLALPTTFEDLESFSVFDTGRLASALTESEVGRMMLGGMPIDVISDIIGHLKKDAKMYVGDPTVDPRQIVEADLVPLRLVIPDLVSRVDERPPIDFKGIGFVEDAARMIRERTSDSSLRLIAISQNPTLQGIIPPEFYIRMQEYGILSPYETMYRDSLIAHLAGNPTLYRQCHGEEGLEIYGNLRRSEANLFEP